MRCFQEQLPEGDNGKEEVQVPLDSQRMQIYSIRCLLSPHLRQRYVGYLLGKGGACIQDIEKVPC